MCGCVGRWCGVSCLPLFSRIPLTDHCYLIESVPIASVKRCLSCCRIITGQPSDRKSEGMFLYVRSAMHLSYPSFAKADTTTVQGRYHSQLPLPDVLPFFTLLSQLTERLQEATWPSD